MSEKSRRLPSTIKQVSRQLRKTQTPMERRLWSRLRLERLDGLRFRRQHPIGHFIVDFYCAEHILVVEIDGPRGTKLFASPAFALVQVQAVLRIDHIFQWHRLAVLDIGRLALGDAHVERVVHFFGTFLGAQAAGDAFVYVDITGFLANRDPKVPFLPADIDDFGKGQNFNV